VEISLIETACIPEVIDPETGAPVAPGVRGELCITTLHRAGSPLIRYRTGDLVTYSAGRAPSGPDYLRLPGGILGRLDDMILVKGNNIYPAAIEAVLCRIPGIAEYRVEVYRREGAAARVRMVIEPAEGAEGSALTEEVARAILDSLYFRPEVALAAPGDLPRFEMKSDRIQYREETVP
jgi:phenylacetate-CoA ligase